MTSIGMKELVNLLGPNLTEIYNVFGGNADINLIIKFPNQAGALIIRAGGNPDIDDLIHLLNVTKQQLIMDKMTKEGELT